MQSLGSFFVFSHVSSILCRGVLAQDAEWKNPDGGNVRLWGQNDKLNWGDQKPVDVIQRVIEKCGAGPTCRADDYSWDTQVVVDGKNQRRKLVVTVTQSTFDPRLPQADSLHMLQSLQKLLASDPWTTSSRQHWDGDTEQASCPSAASNFCWIPNKDEGDLDQYSAPVALFSNFREADHAEVSNVRLEIKTETLEPSQWSCEKVVDSVGTVVNAIKEIPGFQLLDLYCAISKIGN